MEKSHILKDYSEIILSYCKDNHHSGIFVKPNLPAKTGKVLISYPSIKHPNDVLVWLEIKKMFSNEYIAFTGTNAFFPTISFNWDDFIQIEENKNTIVIYTNNSGITKKTEININNEEYVKFLYRLLTHISNSKLIKLHETNSYENYSPDAKIWLELCDEVLKTIDYLYIAFQNGKISLTDYEELKIKLLNRL